MKKAHLREVLEKVELAVRRGISGSPCLGSLANEIAKMIKELEDE